MAKIRIYELAKEFGLDNKELVAQARGLGFEIKSVMSTLTDEQAEMVRRRLGGSASSPSAAASAPSASDEGPSKLVPRKRKGTGKSPAEREREQREREEIERAAAVPAPEPIRRSPEIRRPPRSVEPEETGVSEAASEAAPAPVVRRPVSPTAPTHAGAPAGGPAPTLRPAAPSEPSRPQVAAAERQREVAPAAPERASVQPAAVEEPKPRAVPQVGERIQLPPGTRRLGPQSMAARLEQQKRDEPPPPPPEPAKPVAPVAAPEPPAPRVVEERRPEIKQLKGNQPRPATKRRDDERPVVRNDQGVIVGAASSRSEPKILGFIQLPGGGAAAQRRQQQVIITEANKGKSKGRATARKEREEKSQQRPRRRTPPRRRDRGMPKNVSTIEMSEAKKRIRVDEAIQISDLAHQMGVKAPKVIRTLWGMGMRNLTINHAVDVETAELVAAEFGYTIENVSFQEDEYLTDYDEEEGELRAPVVTIMGHVDHGKTTLLDYIRKAKVAEGEAGGITQHIGAYKVETGQGPVVFIDTPGHEAFTAMRSRGAAVTDIVVLIVAADDGVMPTTREAIEIANESGVPIIVAINKIDKPDANVGRVEQMLMKEGLVGEAYGGETVICHISAKKGTGVEELLELLAVQAEVLELRAPIEGAAVGTVIESRIDKGRGVVATLLVQSGTLVKGDIVVANEFSGKVRDLFTPAGKKINEAPPSTPVEVLGLDGAPPAGERFHVVESERDARQLVAHRRELRRRKESVRSGPSVLERLKSKKIPSLKIVLKADVQGSAEALRETFEELSTEKVRVEVIQASVGAINETDVKLAAAADNALIVGFNVKTVGKAAPLAEQEKIPIETFSIIYEATDRIRERMIDLLEPEYREVEQGQAEVRALFPIPRLGVVAGCRIIRGTVTRSSHVRVKRNGALLYTGKIGSLRVFKDDVREVKEGQECGIVVEGFAEVEPGDILEAFELETIRPEL